jgi:hypothetical protein
MQYVVGWSPLIDIVNFFTKQEIKSGARIVEVI